MSDDLFTRRSRRHCVRLRLDVLEDRATPTVQAFTSVADNTLFEDATGNLSDGAGPHLYVGNTGQTATANARRGLLLFDVSSIPAGSTINSATLSLHVSKVPGGAQNEPVVIHRATNSWGEGTSVAGPGGSGNGEGDGTQATTNDATWTFRFFNTLPWTTVGGDFTATPSATTTVAGVGTYQWTGLANDVQTWLNTPANNLGWILTGDEVTGKTAKQIDSRENTTATNRPTLTVDFTAPASDLTVDVSHVGNFTQGNLADSYSIVVNNIGSGPTSGTVTVIDTLPVGLTPTPANNGSIAGWTVSTLNQTVTATRSDALNPGSSYTALPIIVAVSPTAPANVTNVAVVSGGGEQNTGNDSDSDATAIIPHITGAPQVSISAPSLAFANQTKSVSYTITYTDPDLASVTLKDTDVSLVPTNGTSANITVDGTGDTRTVVLNNILGDGTLAIAIAAGTAVDTGGNLADAAGPSAPFIVDNTPPAVTISPPSVASTAAGLVSWLVTVTDTFLVTPVALNANQVVQVGNPTTVHGSLAALPETNNQIQVALNFIRGGSGTLGFQLPAGWATDQAGNPVAGATSLTTQVTGTRKFRLAAAGPAIAKVGASMTFFIAYRNTGTQQAENVDLVVTLPAGTTFDAKHSSSGWKAIGNGKYRFEVAVIPAGAHARLRFAVVTGPVAPPSRRFVLGVSITDELANGDPLTQRNVVSMFGQNRVR